MVQDKTRNSRNPGKECVSSIILIDVETVEEN